MQKCTSFSSINCFMSSVWWGISGTGEGWVKGSRLLCSWWPFESSWTANIHPVAKIMDDFQVRVLNGLLRKCPGGWYCWAKWLTWPLYTLGGRQLFWRGWPPPGVPPLWQSPHQRPCCTASHSSGMFLNGLLLFSPLTIFLIKLLR